MKRIYLLASLAFFFVLSGCASVPMAPAELDETRKAFTAPPEGQAGLYVYRDTKFGAALRKKVYVNEELVGATAPMTYFYQVLPAGKAVVATQSEFGMNEIEMDLEPGKNHFVRQYIKIGVFVGGANLESMSEEEGRAGVMKCKLAQQAGQ